MNKPYKLLVLAFLFSCLQPARLFAQCTSPNAYGTITVNNPLPAFTNFYNCTYGEEYNTIVVNYAGIYTFSVDNGSVSPIYLTLKNSSGSNLVWGAPPLTATLTSTGTYYLHITETGPPGCTTNQTCHSTDLKVLGLPGSPTVVTQPDSVMACSGSTVQFVCSATPTNCTYQWQEDAGSGFINLTNGGVYAGANSPTLMLSVISSPMNYRTYRCVITNSISSIFTDAALLNVIGNGAMPFAENFNSAFDLPIEWVNSLDGWEVLSGHGTNNSNGMARNLYGSSVTKAEAVSPAIGPITPSTSITFDYRLVDYTNYPATATSTTDIASDSLKVYVSANCGTTYALLGAITAANHTVSTNFVNKSFSLAAYAGMNVLFKFSAVKNPTTSADYYWDVDNINLFNITSVDAGVSAVLSPSTSGCYSVSTPVVVTITNYGTSTLPGIPVTVMAGGAPIQTITGTYSGTLAVGASTTFTVGNINMGMSGVYTFSAYTTLSGDGNSLNDMTVITRTVSPQVNISGPGVICTGNSATLTVSGTAATYTWSGSAGSTSIVVSPTVTTTYSVSGTNTAGCTASRVFTVSVQDPTISAVGGTGCGNPATGSVTVNSFTPSVVSWYAAPSSTLSLGSGNSLTVSAASTSTYYAEASSSAPDSLFTTLAAGNGFAGNMFDVTATSNIAINGVDMHFDSPGTTTVEVWYRPGTFVGFETASTGWTLAHSTTVSTLGTGTLTPVPGTFAINVAAGQTYGLYITSVNGNPQTNYTNGSTLGAVYASNGDLQLLEGNGGGYFNVTNSPRVFNGQLHYEKEGCTSPRIPVVFTVTPTASISIAASSSVICAGQSVTLTAGSASGYTWTPGNANTQSIVVTPTASATFSLMGAVSNCTASAVSTVSVDVCAGIAGYAAGAGISLYPNPSTGNITIAMQAGQHDYVFEVTDISGRMVYRTLLSGSNPGLSLKDLANGLYNYTISTSSNKAVIKNGKLLKQ